MICVFGITDPVSAVADMFSYPFMRYAFIAGTATAAAAGLASYFVVLRGQVFTGDALGHVAFTGALAALAVGMDLRFGLFIATVGGALALGALGAKARADDVVVGSVFAWVLGLGVLFLSVFTRSQSSGNAAGGVRVLFGSIFGLDQQQTILAAVLGVLVCAGIIALGRPLLFATVDEAVAEARGVSIRGLGYVFLVLVAVAVAEATQAVGALLVLGLVAAPGAIAQRLSSNPTSRCFLQLRLASAPSGWD